MRVAVISIPAGNGAKLSVLAQGLGKGLEAAGHRVDHFGPKVDPMAMASYDYLVVGTESSGPWGKLPQAVGTYLRRCQGLGGKRSFAFVRKSGLMPAKLLSRLMRVLEGEGLLITFEEMLSGAEDAAAAGREAPVERA